MTLRLDRRDGSPERRVLIGMVISRAVLGPIAEKWESGLFGSTLGNLVGSWCIAHYKKYHRAPGASITHYFEGWAETARDKETVELVETFLAGLSDEAERIRRTLSPDHLVDMAAELFEKVHLNDLMGRVTAHIERGEVTKARELVDRSRKIEIGMGAGINVLEDFAVVETAFENIASSIIQYPDALGNFFGRYLARDSLIAFMGPEKRGKSFWLLDLAFRGVEQGLNVAYFEVGDMSQGQVLRRIASRASGRPIKEGRYEYPLSIESPESEKKLPALVTEYRAAPHDLTPEEVIRELDILGERVGRKKFKLSCHPNSSINVLGIEGHLDVWARDGWTPDVVVIDYADILAPLNTRDDTREQINSTWKAMRGLSQRLHCLLVTATQSNSESYDSWIITRSNFSEDKRKLAHASAIIGINQTTHEKDKGLYRLNWPVGRDLDFSEKKCVWCAACLSLANPAILSTF